ncbi:MAG TPA: hypothetical protein DD490_04080 [Acidobacteria bacterium]|nr:hypothetical protein [Acidobacteriota bacterium]
MRGAFRTLWVTLLLTAVSAAHPLSAEEIQGDSYWGSREEWKDFDPVAPVLHETAASFVWEDDRYQLHATAAPGRSSHQVLLDAIRELAPGLAIDCFSRWTEGSWDDLAAAGLGDPRPAVPAAYAPAGMSLTFYRAPAAGCPPAAPAPAWPLRFSAGFTTPAGARLDLAAEWTAETAAERPGRLTATAASWIEDHLAYVVTFTDPALDPGTVTAVATALDPAFQKECTRWVAEGSAARLTERGMARIPVVPPGFEEISSSQVLRAAQGGCTTGTPLPTEFAATWVFTAGNVVLEVGAIHDATVKEDPTLEGLTIADNFVRWTDTEGTAYYVFSHTLDDGPALGQEDLFAVARSLDPAVPLPEP